MMTRITRNEAATYRYTARRPERPRRLSWHDGVDPIDPCNPCHQLHLICVKNHERWFTLDLRPIPPNRTESEKGALPRRIGMPSQNRTLIPWNPLPKRRAANKRGGN
jgi:hypothetical protein